MKVAMNEKETKSEKENPRRGFRKRVATVSGGLPFAHEGWQAASPLQPGGASEAAGRRRAAC